MKNLQENNTTKGWTEKDKKDFAKFVESQGSVTDLFWVVLLLNPFIIVPCLLVGIVIFTFGLFKLIWDLDYPPIDYYGETF